MVIGSTMAKNVYLEMMQTLGVEISLGKSVLSPDGRSFEFTKRNIVDGTDVSPIS